VENMGDTVLTNVTLLDGDITPAYTDVLGALEVGQSVTVAVSRAVSGTLTNLAGVTGYDPNGDPVSDADEAVVLEIAPALRLVKTVGFSATEYSSLSTLQAADGVLVTYWFVVENTGDSALAGVTLNDPQLGLNMSVSDLSPGASITSSVPWTVTGAMTNTATVIGHDPNGDAVVASGMALITQALLTVRADDKMVTYGEPMPHLTYTISGYLPGDDATAVSGTPVLSTDYVGLGCLTPAAEMIQIISLTADGVLTWAMPSHLIYECHLEQTDRLTGLGWEDILGPIQPTGDVMSVHVNRCHREKFYRVTAMSAGVQPSGCTVFTPVSLSPIPIHIAAGTLFSSTYNFQFEAGYLTIEPRSLAIKADDHEKELHTADPVFTATCTGFAAGEGPDNLLGELSLLRVAGEAVGDYPITPGGVTNPNYDITFWQGILTILDNLPQLTLVSASWRLDMPTGLFEGTMVFRNDGGPVPVDNDYWFETPVTDEWRLWYAEGTRPNGKTYVGMTDQIHRLLRDVGNRDQIWHTGETITVSGVWMYHLRRVNPGSYINPADCFLTGQR
jgi:hypothetical protein